MSEHTPGPWTAEKAESPSPEQRDELLAAAQIVLAGLNARIDAAPSTAKPVFNGIADLHAAVAKATGAQPNAAAAVRNDRALTADDAEFGMIEHATPNQLHDRIRELEAELRDMVKVAQNHLADAEKAEAERDAAQQRVEELEGAMHLDARFSRDAAVADTIERCLQIVDQEDELTAPMPPQIYLAPIQDVARAAVRATKKSIAAAIRALAKAPASDGYRPSVGQ